MSITLSPGDQKKAKEPVASGRFSTVDDVVHAAIEALDENPDW